MKKPVIIVLAFFLSGCPPKEELVILPEIQTAAISYLTDISATAGGIIVSDGNGSITDCGVYWGVKDDPEVSGEKISAGGGKSIYVVNLTNLSEHSTYYVKAYALNNAGEKLGTLVVFTTFYTMSEPEEITFPHDDIVLNGIFVHPADSGKYPVFIITPGSGGTDKDGTFAIGNSQQDNCLYSGLINLTIWSYKELAIALAGRGYSVLRYDKPGIHFNLCDPSIKKSFFKYYLATESAIDYVKTRSEVDAGKIILLGHSEGSFLIPYMALHRQDVRALISLAGARSPLDSIIAYQDNYVKNNCFAGNCVECDEQAKEWLNYCQKLRQKDFYQAYLERPLNVCQPEEITYRLVGVEDSVAINYNICNLPSLFLKMGADWVVPEGDFERMQHEISAPSDFYVMPGLIHFLCPLNFPHISPSIPDTIDYWIRQKLM